MNMIKLNFTPSLICFVSKLTSFSAILAVTDQNAPTLRLIRAEQSLVERKNEGAQVIIKQADIHDEPISFVKFNSYSNYAVSFAGGVPEVWDPDTLELPSTFEIMSDTDLYELCDMKVIAAEFSPVYFVVLTLEGKLVLFN